MMNCQTISNHVALLLERNVVLEDPVSYLRVCCWCHEDRNFLWMLVQCWGRKLIYSYLYTN